MPVITSSMMITGVLTYIGTQLSQNDSIKEFFNDFTGATVDWIRPLFLTEEDKPTKSAEALKDNPESKNHKNHKKLLETQIEIALDEDEQRKAFLKTIFDKISETKEGGEIVTNIINSRNVVTGNITAGGNVIVGDNNNTDRK